jgi:hypothetical protein
MDIASTGFWCHGAASPLDSRLRFGGGPGSNLYPADRCVIADGFRISAVQGQVLFRVNTLSLTSKAGRLEEQRFIGA